MSSWEKKLYYWCACLIFSAYLFLGMLCEEWETDFDAPPIPPQKF